VTGEASAVHIASADLGGQLYSIVPIGVGVAPRITDSPRGPRLALAKAGVEVRLSARVSWTVRVAATSSEQTIDMRAGGLAAIDLTGASARAELTLPRPKATGKVTVSAPIRSLRLSTAGAVPVRLRLAGGAQTAVLDGKTHRKVKPRTTLTPAGWRTAKLRYDVSAPAALGSVLVSAL